MKKRLRSSCSLEGIFSNITGDRVDNLFEEDPSIDSYELSHKPVAKRSDLREIFNGSNFIGNYITKEIEDLKNSKYQLFFVKLSIGAPEISKELYSKLKRSTNNDEVVPYRLIKSGIELGVIARSGDDVMHILKDHITGLGYDRRYYHITKITQVSSQMS